MRIPCQGCTDRVVGCHANCKRYQEWREWHKKEVEEERGFLSVWKKKRGQK